MGAQGTPSPGGGKGQGALSPKPRTCYLLQKHRGQCLYFQPESPRQNFSLSPGNMLSRLQGHSDGARSPARFPGSISSRRAWEGVSIALSCIKCKCYFFPFLELTYFNEVYR